MELCGSPCADRAGLPLMAADIIHLSGIVRSPLLGSDGERMGRVEDVIARPGEQAHPPVIGIVAKIGRRQLFVPISMIGSVHPGCVQLHGETLNLARFERRPASCSSPRTCRQGT